MTKKAVVAILYKRDFDDTDKIVSVHNDYFAADQKGRALNEPYWIIEYEVDN